MRRYSNISIIKNTDDKNMYQTVKYPEIGRSFEDIYVYTTIGDRFDTLAQQYYGDSSLWWVIANANGSLRRDSLTPPIGTQLRIPSNPTSTLSAFKNINPPSTVASTAETSNTVSTPSSGVSGGGGGASGGGY